MIVRRAAEDFRPIERPLHEVEGLVKNLCCQLFNGFRRALGRKQFAEHQGWLARLADHLHRLVLAGQERKPEHFLPVHHFLQGGFAALRREQPADVDHRANVVRDIRRRHG